MRLRGTKLSSIAQSGGLGNQLWDLASSRPSLDLQFADTKSLVDATTGQNLIDFSRASGGTYVDSQGVIRNATTNLLLRSEELGTTWTQNNINVSSNSITSPSGTATADKITETTVNSEHNALQQVVSVISSTSYTLSCYAKKGERSILALSPTEPGVANYYTWFDLDTGTVLNNTAGNTASIAAVGNGWYRCTITRTTSASQTAINVKLGISTSNGTSSYTGDGTSGIYLWGAQLEQSSTVGEYIPTTSSINSAPRFDHNPSTGESLGLLAEEARTNLATWSQVIRLSEWPNQQATTQAINQATAPDGTNTASTLTENSQLANRFIAQTIAVTNTAHTWSVFAKTKERRRILLRESSISGAAAAFDVTSGTVVGTAAGATATITAYSNGWFRCTMTYTPSTASNRIHSIYLLPDDGTSFATASYQGDNASGIYLWGAQLEAGAVPTSYIKTEAATATRAADIAQITGTNFSSWYRQDEGTVFVSASRDTGISTINRIASITDGTNNNRVFDFRQDTSAVGYAISVTSGATDLLTTLTLNASSRSNKLAIAQQLNNGGQAVNGTAYGPDTSVAMPVVNQLNIGNLNGSTQYGGQIARLTFWPQRLPNATLQSITR